MFYLKEFFKSLGENPIRGFFFFLFTCLLAFSLTHRPWVAKTVEKITPEKMVNPYFAIVIDGTLSPEAVRLAASKLPGVMGITTMNDSDKKISALVSDLGSDYVLPKELMNFQTLRVILSPSLSKESLNFIRKEITKVGSKEHLSATEVKFPEVAGVMNAHPFYAFLRSAGDWGTIGILALFWIVSFWLSYDVFRSRAYIIEKFQRKSMVAGKAYLSGLLLVSVLFSALGFLNGTLKFFDLVLLAMVFSVFGTFSLQNWRWKSA
jgi:hypothetical protein